MSLRETDIRPTDLLNEYLRLSELDGQSVLQRHAEFTNRTCPGCQSSSVEPAFQKNGFHLVRCRQCQTLFVNPAPTMETMEHFYTASPSARYWADVFFPAVTPVRRDAIYKPRAARVLEIAKSLQLDLSTVIDVGAGAGLFLEELQKQSSDTHLCAVEPSPSHGDDLQSKGIRTFGGFSGAASTDPDWAGIADMVTCFEVLEHVAEPDTLFRELRLLARPGGLVIVTGLSGSGFDVQTLGKHSKPVSPPHHLTFLTIEGTDALVRRCGLELVDISTPGELDVDIVRNAALEAPERVSDPFIRNLVLTSPEETRVQFQNFLKANALSSHMWIIARRPLD